ncbi:metallophosphoesterase [Bowmanella yangjiangensis]|uniref:Metallophosphoesterase n=1 Tax=Bowmanella yangjiangensis TaxID=2811230 RepID=A0ABS3CT25_9ALTE|nr:metallophosphoesterase [Bowmanella yangjiangensis]MBN7820272.1 metallophosphoesterase [Bowmanella yangjiangensis]
MLVGINMRHLLISAVLVCASGIISADTLDDGPYVFTSLPNWQALWVCAGEAKARTLPEVKSAVTIEECGLQAQLQPQAAKRPVLEYPQPSKLAAISDIHGQFELFKTLLTAHGIMDKQGNWQFGQGHLVITGDIFDRGPRQTEALWLIYQLQHQALEAGGKLHFLLGNHEMMVLNGDLRYLNEKYEKIATLLNRPFPALYGEDTVLGQWLRSRNVLVKVGELLFLHGGLHPDLAKEGRTLAEINQVFSGQLIEDKDHPREGFTRYLHKTNGPIWYRGYFRFPQASNEDIDALRSHFGVNSIVVGHTTQEHVSSFYDGKIIAIDSGIKNGENGEMLLIENGKRYRGLLDGSRVSL